MDNDDVMFILQNVSRTLAMIPAADLERWVNECDEANQKHVSFAPLLDPGAYIANLHSGQLEDAENQGRIARALLQARKAIDARELFAASVRDKSK